MPEGHVRISGAMLGVRGLALRAGECFLWARRARPPVLAGMRHVASPLLVPMLLLVCVCVSVHSWANLWVVGNR